MTSITNNVPITLIAQFEDVAVFQTAAFSNGDNTAISRDSNIKLQQVEPQTQANYGAFNLGLHVNDDAKKVLINRMHLLTAINEQLSVAQRLSIERLYWVNQVHGKQIYHVDDTVLSMRPLDADAMISRQATVGLAIMTADCVPIVLYQPTTGKIAAIHAGWQGLACGVIKATAEQFCADKKIVAWVGVCISQENYEVGSQVRDKLLAGCLNHQTLSAEQLNNFAEAYVLESEIDKVKLNLPKLAADQLRAAGITVSNQSKIPCSYVDAHYYSYRRQTHLGQPATGRMALIITRSTVST